MANSLLTPNVIAKEALLQLENSMVMGNLVHRDFKKEFVKVGGTVTVRKPIIFNASDGATRVNQDISEQSTTLTVGSRKHVSWNFSSQDLTLTIDEYPKRYIKPAMSALANQVDMDLCSQFSSVYRAVGTAGTTPSTFASVAAAGQKLDEAACPPEDRRLVVNPAGYWSLAGSLLTLYNQNIVKEAAQKGYLGRFANFETYMDQNITKQTKGVATGTPVSNGANQTGGTIVTNGWTASTTGILKAGDIITFAGVYEVNPQSKLSTGSLKQFVVTSDVNSDSSGNATIPVSPALVTSGNYQNGSGPIANSSAITIVNTHAANLAFHKNAFALVMVPLELPDGAPFKAQESYNGMSVRVVKDYDVANDVEIIRLDIMYGVAAIYPELAVRLLG